MLKKLSLFVLIALLGILVFSCNTGGEESPFFPEGTWQLETITEDQNGTVTMYSLEQWEITASEIVYSTSYVQDAEPAESYTADIISWDSGLNGGETTFSGNLESAMDTGYAVIEYSSGTDTDKFNVFRWGSSTSGMAFTQGYKAVDLNAGDYTNDLFDSAADAESGVTYAAGYFNFCSNGASKIEP